MEACQILIKARARIFQANEDNRQPLWFAARDGERARPCGPPATTAVFAAKRQRHDHGRVAANHNAMSNGLFANLFAITTAVSPPTGGTGYTEVVRALLEAGGDASLPDGKTAEALCCSLRAPTRPVQSTQQIWTALTRVAVMTSGLSLSSQWTG